MDKTWNNKAWFMVLPVLLLVAFNAIIPLMTVVNYSVQETFGNNLFFFEGVKWFQEVLASERFHAALLRQFLFTGIILLIEIPLGVAVALTMPRSGPWVSVCLVLMALPLLIPWNVVGAMWNIFALPDIGLLGYGINALGIDYNFTRQTISRLVHRRPDGRLALDLAGRAARLCRPALDPRRLLPGRQDRQRLALGGVPLHPAAQDEARADHRGAAALHGLLHGLHRAVRAHRRRAGQCHDLPVDRPRQGRARRIQPRHRGGDEHHLLPDDAAGLLGLLHPDDQVDAES